MIWQRKHFGITHVCPEGAVEYEAGSGEVLWNIFRICMEIRGRDFMKRMAGDISSCI